MATMLSVGRSYDTGLRHSSCVSEPGQPEYGGVQAGLHVLQPTLGLIAGAVAVAKGGRWRGVGCDEFERHWGGLRVLLGFVEPNTIRA